MVSLSLPYPLLSLPLMNNLLCKFSLLCSFSFVWSWLRKKPSAPTRAFNWEALLSQAFKSLFSKEYKDVGASSFAVSTLKHSAGTWFSRVRAQSFLKMPGCFQLDTLRFLVLGLIFQTCSKFAWNMYFVWEWGPGIVSAIKTKSSQDAVCLKISVGSQAVKWCECSKYFFCWHWGPVRILS